MSAIVRYYYMHPEDETITLFIDCQACSVSWGWGGDEEKLKQWATEHNELRHSGPRRSV